MSVPLRRTLYGLLAGFGLALMLPLLVHGRRLQTELLETGPLTAAADPAVATQLARLGALFLVGLCLATGFLYAALSTGYTRAWRPHRNGSTRCGRCQRQVSEGARRCDSCGQHLVW